MIEYFRKIPRACGNAIRLLNRGSAELESLRQNVDRLNSVALDRINSVAQSLATLIEKGDAQLATMIEKGDAQLATLIEKGHAQLALQQTQIALQQTELRRLAVQIVHLSARVDELAVPLLGERAEPHPIASGPVPTVPEPHRTLPPILINTMPKSGSIYVTRTVASSLGIEYSLKSLAYGFFPNYFMIPNALEPFRRGDIVRQEHFDASPINLTLCGRYIDRMVLHVRDPRQAMLSWTHHVNRLLKLHPNSINFTIHHPPPDFIDWRFDKQLDWHIDRHLVSLVTWLRQWLAVAQTQSSLKILWTTYEELVNNERALFDRILEFHGIPMDRFDFRPPEKTMEVHYRSGQPDEWKAALTAEQKTRCADIIGRDLLDHFNWSTG